MPNENFEFLVSNCIACITDNTMEFVSFGTKDISETTAANTFPM